MGGTLFWGSLLGDWHKRGMSSLGKTHVLPKGQRLPAQLLSLRPKKEGRRDLLLGYLRVF